MTRFGSLILCATLGAAGVALSACGSNGSSDSALLGLFPRGGEIAGWSIDQTSAKTKGVVAATGTDEASTEALIDGASADFFKSPSTPVMFGVQNYVNTTLANAPADGTGVKIKLYILQMPSPAQASGLYTSLSSATLYSPYTWTDPSSPVVGDHSRVTNATDTWWINFYKGVYYGEVWLTPSYGPAPDYTPGDAQAEAAAFAFANAVVAKM